MKLKNKLLISSLAFSLALSSAFTGALPAFADETEAAVKEEETTASEEQAEAPAYQKTLDAFLELLTSGTDLTSETVPNAKEISSAVMEWGHKSIEEYFKTQYSNLNALTIRKAVVADTYESWVTDTVDECWTSEILLDLIDADGLVRVGTLNAYLYRIGDAWYVLPDYFSDNEFEGSLVDGTFTVEEYLYSHSDAAWEVYATEDGYNYVLLYDGTAEIQAFPSGEEKLTVPATLDGHAVTRISSNAASYSDFKEVVLPEGLLRIGNYAFENSSNLQSVQLPSTLQRIGQSAFASCPELTEIVLPENLEALGEQAFAWCNGLKSVTIPASITQLGSSAFLFCEALTTVTLSEGMKKIGPAMFAYCGALKEISLPESLEEIADSAFAGTGLSSVKLGKNVKKVAGNAFASTRVAGFELDPENTVLEVKDNVLFEKESATLLSYPARTSGRSYAVPEGTKHIAPYAFQYSGLQTITFPETLESIGNHAFNLSALQKVEIPASVKSIGHDAFNACFFLKEARLPEGLTELEDYVFSTCNLTSVSLPSTLVKIGQQALGNNGSLKSITLPEGLVEIGEDAFSGCHSLETITLPAALTTIGANAFYNTALKAFAVADGNTVFSVIDGVLFADNGKVLFAYPAGLKEASYTIPEGVTAIKDNVFANVETLKEVKFPASLETIGSNAFAASGLTTLTIPGSVKETGTAAFMDCENLKTVVLEEGVEIISGNAFNYCEKLETVTIPSTVKEIQDSAFGNCTALKEVTLPDGLVSIGSWIFNGCENLHSLTIPASVEKIEWGAFDGCAEDFCLYAAKDSFAYEWATSEGVTVKEIGK